MQAGCLVTSKRQQILYKGKQRECVKWQTAAGKMMLLLKVKPAFATPEVILNDQVIL